MLKLQDQDCKTDLKLYHKNEFEIKTIKEYGKSTQNSQHFERLSGSYSHLID